MTTSGWQNNPPFNVDEAQQRGVDVYEVLVTDWGRADLPTPVITWPPAGSIPVSLAGIAIGPRSTVDRAFVSYNLQKQRLVGIDPDTTDRIRRLSLDSPLIFTQAANPRSIYTTDANVIDQMTQKGMLQIFSYLKTPTDTFEFPDIQDTTILPGVYIDVNGNERDWLNPGLPILTPTLHLYLYLKAPPSYVPPKRFPLQISGFKDSNTPEGAEALIANIPTFGRKTIQLMIRGDNAGGATTYDFRIGALRAIAPTDPFYEQPLDGTTTPVAAGVPTILSSCAGVNTVADYVNIYATPHGGVGVIDWTLTAYD